MSTFQQFEQEAEVPKADQIQLDDPIRAALTSAHKGLAEGGALAQRYPSEVAPFGYLHDRTPQSFEALRRLIPPGGHVVLFTVEKVSPPETLRIQMEFELDQMVANFVAPPADTSQIVTLGRQDVPDMQRLVEMTKPGPFCARTHELGDYLGIRSGGELVALAGERMRFGRHVEISAVCVHPNHRGKHYAQTLIATLSQSAFHRGEIPMLHVKTDNQSAIALYSQLGFIKRRVLHVTILADATADQ
ncbi:GNAT family N-acetyltransferase [Rhizobium tubonense]|uniref:GNAT family N-acetyltransferase n=1 Tax=Rhizobium tubonense TaxID=484088 RepID=A0A2W4C1H6_9HYPH|nr:GNAT family N-acetyltransferase [Rhizobium tubonense]PZM07357.1 GNAT family N-acetyltransferase [Rhizobium tubonense]